MAVSGKNPSGAREITLVRYVLKNISRRKLRSGLTISGIAICIAFFIVLAAISTGLNNYIQSELEERKEGTIYIYRPVPFSPDEFETLRAVTDEYFADSDIDYAITPTIEVTFIRKYGAAGFESNVEYYNLMGCGPEGVHTHWEQYDFTEKLHSGEHLDTIGQTQAGIVMGYRLWNDYYSNKTVGDTIDIVPKNISFKTVPWTMHDRYIAGDTNYTTEDIPPIRDVKLVGILAQSKGYRWVDYIGFLPMEFMLKAFKLYDDKNDTYYYPGITILIDDATDLDFSELEFMYKEAVVGAEGWDNRFEMRLDWLEDMENTVSSWFNIIITIISLVSIIGVSNTMLMSVSERRTELGILRALGFSRGKIKQLIFAEAIAICLIAYCISLVLGVWVSHYFNTQYELSLGLGESSIFFSPAQVSIEIVLASFCIAVLFGTIAALYPAHRATKVDPVEALRYG
ncbi:MAG: ABC transporter permease [Thermoplasmata archaeon]|nr:MAG: ABC transporter permease [Thermoplasmata archaeon]